MMAQDNFERCVAKIFDHEGGYVNHPKDPGRATNMGITIGTLSDWRGKPATVADVKALTRAEAREIYRARYWNAVRGDDLPAGIDLVTFDPAVNSGVRRGAQWLQRALGATPDGKIGPITVSAARAADAVTVIKRACQIRMGFLTGLKTFSTFGRGWSRRVAEIEAAAVAMTAVGAARPVLLEQHAIAKAQADRAQNGALASGAGGGGAGALADLPTWGAIGVVAAAAVVCIILIGQARHDRARERAYQSTAIGVAK